MNKERFFKVVKVTKTGQKESITKGLDNLILTGTPDRAAKKAMTRICRIKKIKGVCALRIKLVELKPTKSYTAPMIENGKFVHKKTNNKEKVYEYRLQRRVDPVTVKKNGQEIFFKYSTKITSYLNRK